MSVLRQDIRYALRHLRKSPGFTAVAVITLALGIGVNTAIFGVVNAVPLRLLGFKDVNHVPTPGNFLGITRFSASSANYLDWEKQNHVFERIAIYAYRSFDLTGGDKPEQLDVCAVSSGLFATLGVQPMLRRVFSPEEHQPGRSHVVVLNHWLWQGHFGGDPDIVRCNNLDGTSYLVASVMPARLLFPDFAQMWTPMAWTDQERGKGWSPTTRSTAFRWALRTIYFPASFLVDSNSSGVVRAVIHKPALLLADEPTGNLHSPQEKEMMELFRGLNEPGATIVRLTHSDTNAAYGSRTIQLSDSWMVSDTANPEQPREAVKQ